LTDIFRILLPYYSDYIHGDTLAQHCRKGHASIVQQLINAGACSHLTDRRFLLDALVFDPACPIADRQSVIEVLLTAGCPVAVHSPRVWQLAGQSGVLALIKHMVGISSGETRTTATATGTGTISQHKIVEALHGASENGYLDIVKYLLDIAKTYQYDLHDLAFVPHHHKDVFEYLCTHFNIDFVNTDDSQKLHLLQSAVVCQCTDIVSTLLNNNHIDITPTNILSLATDTTIINLLLDAKAAVNAPGYDTATLTSACMQLKPDAVALLLAHGADVNGAVRGKSLFSGVLHAKWTDDKKEDLSKVIKLMLEAGVDIQGYNKEYSTELWIQGIVALREPNRSVLLSAMISHDPSLVAKCTSSGASQLFQAISVSHDIDVPTVKTLLDAGAVVPVYDSNNEPLLQPSPPPTPPSTPHPSTSSRPS
jgi:ankyrin repeat protein